MLNQNIEELLKVLILDEEEQYNWLWKRHDTFGFDLEWVDFDTTTAKKEIRRNLADLAFRLRDASHYMIGWCAWDRACWEVWKYVKIRQNSNIFERKHLSLCEREKYCYHWMAFWAEPIHQVIVALITKEIVADSEEKFDAHLVSEDFKEEEHTKCGRCGGIDGKHKQVDDPQAGNSHMLTKMQCPNDNNEKRPLAYGIAQDDGKGGFGFWWGPNPYLEEMLGVEGQNKNSVIWRFNVDGTDDLIYRWGGDIWIEVEEVKNG